MVRLLAVAVAVALLSPAAGQAVRQPADEFSLLDLPRPSAMLSGFPMMNLGRLLDGFEKTADLQQGEGAGPVGGVVRVIRLPPALSSLLGGAPQPQPEERPVVRMHIGLPFMLGSAGLSRPLQELRSLASGCVPCGRAQTVQSHMRSVSVMHGPDGQRVETVTEVRCSSRPQTWLLVAGPERACLSRVDAVLSLTITRHLKRNFGVARPVRTAKSTPRGL
jgi:hypothetical protein